MEMTGNPSRSWTLALRVRSWNRSGMSRTLTGYLLTIWSVSDDRQIVVEGERDIDFVDVLVLDDPADVFDFSQDRPLSAVHPDVVPGLAFVVQEPLDDEPEVLVLNELLGDGDPHFARADDEDVLEVAAARVAALHDEIDLVAEDRDREDDADEIENEKSAGRLDQGDPERLDPAAEVRDDDSIRIPQTTRMVSTAFRR